MYDRAPRKLTLADSRTPTHVGPGTYPRHEITNSKPPSDGYAPFMSLSDRDTILVHESILEAPGPGAYDPQPPQDAVKGGSALTNKAKRFDLVLATSPGPAAYNINTEWVKDTICLAPSSAPPILQQEEKSCKGTLFVANRIKFCRKPSTPSIPCPGQAYGFEETEDGTLQPQQPLPHDTTIGPAFYTPVLVDTETTKKYKGIHWGKMRGQRTDFAGKEGPGPGEYHPAKDCKCKGEAVTERGERCKFESFIPRYTDQLVREEIKESQVKIDYRQLAQRPHTNSTPHASSWRRDHALMSPVKRAKGYWGTCPASTSN